MHSNNNKELKKLIKNCINNINGTKLNLFNILLGSVVACEAIEISSWSYLLLEMDFLTDNDRGNFAYFNLKVMVPIDIYFIV